MKKCIAYFPLGSTRQAWVPCARPAVDKSVFCRKHGEAIAGAVLGFCVNGMLERECDAKGMDTGETNERSKRKSAADKIRREEQPS
jgi:hypothetical protein